MAAVDFARLLALRHDRAVAGRRVEAAEARAARADPLGERALGHELDLQRAVEVLPLEGRVLAHVGTHHLSDLPCFEQQPEPEVVHAAVVAHHREVLHAECADARDEVLRDAAQAEAAGQDDGPVLEPRARERLGGA